MRGTDQRMVVNRCIAILRPTVVHAAGEDVLEDQGAGVGQWWRWEQIRGAGLEAVVGGDAQVRPQPVGSHNLATPEVVALGQILSGLPVHQAQAAVDLKLVVILGHPRWVDLLNRDRTPNGRGPWSGCPTCLAGA